MTPLDEFANSMRRIRNDDGTEVVSSSLVKLGPGLVASRPNGAPGETTFATIDAPGVASQAAQIAALTARVEALEAMLDGTGTVTFARVITGFLSAPPTAPTRSLTIQVPGALAESYEDAIEMAWTTTDMTPEIKLGFFGGSPVVQQTIPAVSVLADTEAALEASNLIERLP